MICATQFQVSEKHCSKCGNYKGIDLFSKCSSAHDGRQAHCKSCQAAFKREKYWQNPEQQRARVNKCRNKEVQRAWLEKNKDRQNLLRKARVERYRLDPEWKKKQADYVRERRRNDPCFRFASYQRARIGGILRYGSKLDRTVELLGGSVKSIVNILTGGTNIIPDGYHFDHYVPVAYFDLSDRRQQFVCFNWRNLRLIPAHENHKKLASVPDDAGIIIKAISEALSLDSASL